MQKSEFNFGINKHIVIIYLHICIVALRGSIHMLRRGSSGLLNLQVDANLRNVEVS